MITVQELIYELKKYPGEAMCYAYEGEETGVVVVRAYPVEKISDRQLAFIPCREMWEYKEGPSGPCIGRPCHE